MAGEILPPFGVLMGVSRRLRQKPDEASRWHHPCKFVANKAADCCWAERRKNNEVFSYFIFRCDRILFIGCWMSNASAGKNAEKIHLYWLRRRRTTLFSLSWLPHLFRCLYKPGLNKRLCIYSRMDNIFLRKLIFSPWLSLLDGVF